MKALQVVVVIHLIAVFVQAVLAGQFLSGSDGAVFLHEAAGWVVAAIGLVQVLMTLLANLRKEEALVLMLAGALIFLAEALQVGTGYLRFLGVHVPLAILIGAGVSAVAVRVFRT